MPQLTGTMLGRRSGKKLEARAKSAMAANDGVFAKCGRMKTAERFATKVARKSNGLGHQFAGFGDKIVSRRRIYLEEKLDIAKGLSLLKGPSVPGSWQVDIRVGGGRKWWRSEQQSYIEQVLGK